MKTHALVLTLAATTTLGLAAAQVAHAQQKPAAPAGNCKTFGGNRCCDPSITAHLSKESVFSACGESDATFLGEKGSNDGCKYYFKVPGEKDEEMYVEIFAQKVKGTPPMPADPFVTWKKVVGSVMMAEPKSLKGATNPKVKAMAGDTSGSIGLWMPGQGYSLMVSSSAKICSKTDAKRLAASMR